MTEENKQLDEMSPVEPQTAQGVPPGLQATVNPTDEYKVGHNRPPLVLIAIYIFVILWCAISWIPFYGY